MQGCTYLEVEQEEEHMRRVIALAHTLRQHFQPSRDGSFEARICDLLGKKELERLQKANDMPIHAISDITRGKPRNLATSVFGIPRLRRRVLEGQIQNHRELHFATKKL